MLPLPDERLLAIWENREASDADVGTRLLHEGAAVDRGDNTEDWPLSRRQAALLEMRCATFGRTMLAAVDCPRCTERLEFELDGRALLDMHDKTKNADSSRTALQIRGLKFRLPTLADLVSVRSVEGEPAAILALVSRCCLETPPETWPQDLIDEVDEHFEAADPLGNLQLTFDCPGCRHTWQQAFNIAQYFWEEIDVRAKTILVQVHRLARAYGWSEKDVLAMNPARRRAYLELIAG
jgi:hypothetical protein